MEGQELANLAKDIADHGLLERISLYGGAILDGRNRLRACRMAGVEPLYQEIYLNEKSPTLFAVSRNLHRRQLNETQRSTIAADMVPMLEQEARDRQREAAVHTNEKRWHASRSSLPARVPEAITPKETLEFRGETRYKAGEATGVSPRTVQSAIYVKKNNSELFAKMQRGEIPARTAERLARASAVSRASQKEKMVAPGKRQQMLQEAAKKKLVHGLSMMKGMSRGLPEIKISYAVAALPPGEVKVWVQMAREIARDLNAFARCLEEVSK
jgi:hypothetical protein